MKYYIIEIPKDQEPSSYFLKFILKEYYKNFNVIELERKDDIE